jgi:pimeloyl-ACP methyl ester carboxylesterase
MRFRSVIAGAVVIAAAAAWALSRQLPALGAGGLLRPMRRAVDRSAPDRCGDVSFTGAGVTLKGWRCSASAPPRGTIVYLHGVADNRVSATGVIERFLARGFDVVAYDSRAHGASGGDICTYGFFEKQDLHHVIDSLDAGPVVLIGTSLGAAVALQEAADDRRVLAVVAAETFSDLRTVARERAPFFFTPSVIADAFSLAERNGRFVVDAVSPVAAASRITVPVLLLHGSADRDTPPAHSQRVFEALHGPRQFIRVPGAHHNESLRPSVWHQVEIWIDEALTPA